MQRIGTDCRDPEPGRACAPEHCAALRKQLPSQKCGQNNDMKRDARFCPKPCSPIWHIRGIGDNQVAAM
jgi:hypothetical protein